jgi:hypothetical protein
MLWLLLSACHDTSVPNALRIEQYHRQYVYSPDSSLQEPFPNSIRLVGYPETASIPELIPEWANIVLNHTETEVLHPPDDKELMLVVLQTDSLPIDSMATEKPPLSVSKTEKPLEVIAENWLQEGHSIYLKLYAPLHQLPVFVWLFCPKNMPPPESVQKNWHRFSASPAMLLHGWNVPQLHHRLSALASMDAPTQKLIYFRLLRKAFKKELDSPEPCLLSLSFLPAVSAYSMQVKAHVRNLSTDMHYFLRAQPSTKTQSYSQMGYVPRWPAPDTLLYIHHYSDSTNTLYLHSNLWKGEGDWALHQIELYIDQPVFHDEELVQHWLQQLPLRSTFPTEVNTLLALQKQLSLRWQNTSLLWLYLDWVL